MKVEAKKQTAEAAYEKAAAKVAAQLVALQAKLETHRAEFAASGSKNWGYVGDLNHYADVLSAR